MSGPAMGTDCSDDDGTGGLHRDRQQGQRVENGVGLPLRLQASGSLGAMLTGQCPSIWRDLLPRLPIRSAEASIGNPVPVLSNVGQLFHEVEEPRSASMATDRRPSLNFAACSASVGNFKMNTVDGQPPEAASGVPITKAS